MKRAVFVSDVHLVPGSSPGNGAFIGFLDSLRRLHDSGQPQELYVLGDLFSFWVDRPLMLGLYRPVLDSLAGLSRSGCTVTLLEGNRDFGLGRVLADASGAVLAGERLVIDRAGRRALLLHGDQLLSNDRRYRVFRRVVRCFPARLAARWVPAPVLLRAVGGLERVSSVEKARKPGQIMDVDPDSAVREARAAGAELVFHGHTHRPGVSRPPAGGEAIAVFSLGSWSPAGGTVLVWPEGGDPELTDWTPAEPS